ncbi:type VI secretion protein [Burkholderia sp. Leaf177]|uniref:type VI secretion system lipoprotein TssJ n=1 Tax=Burkholderia sp. Leaf177 TaxID=1736287 RepID=UPI0006F1F503|nr:type VI secretion system lipoprotein TssJ [Burkholderia sp. Leaf177]KQR73578.1 type VI secretion protein [Burkholderia sp. Leaf177]
MINRTMHRAVLFAAVCTTLALGACGVAQSVKTGTVDAAKWAFTTQIKTMNLDLVSRSSINTSGAGQSLSTVVRVYQLKTPQAFEQLDYARLESNDLDALKPDLLSATDVVLRPNANASISEPMNDDAQFVAIVAFFREDSQRETWRIVLPRKQWKQGDPVRIEVRDSSMTLIGKGSQAVTQQPTVRSTPRQTADPQPRKTVSTTQGAVSRPTAKLVSSRDDWARPAD